MRLPFGRKASTSNKILKPVGRKCACMALNASCRKAKNPLMGSVLRTLGKCSAKYVAVLLMILRPVTHSPTLPPFM